eukprot:TRINITY_DN3554_c0_g1_i1.p1 TRINITY_DN3554_c0_g1~~TRINITY_DN3554_c0_g1_i1.p1  ORF type:complete len:448 (+),score=84.12 TRINITY_DN3554_c0_g1_i1:53-1345(+)
MDHGNGIFQYDGKVYTILATGTQCQTAKTTLAHLKSKKFVNKRVTVPDEIWASLQEQSEHEQAVARENRKRKIGTPKEKKRTRLQQEYLIDRERFGTDQLYRKDTQEGEDPSAIRYDCAVCGMYVAAHALIAHVASVEHKQKLAASSFDEDLLFIKAERETCLQAERTAAGSKWCEPCQKWIGGPCWDNHVRGRSHIQMLPWEEQQRLHNQQQQQRLSSYETHQDSYGSNIDKQYPAPPSAPGASYQHVPAAGGASATDLVNKFPANGVPLFCCGEDMWNTNVVFTAAEYTRLSGFRTQLCVPETQNWGTASNPALVAGLIRDPEAMSLGVCYIISRETLLGLIEEKKASNQNLVEATQDSETYPRCLTFTCQDPGISIGQAAQQVVSAAGVSGPNYNLLVRIQHEYERQDWKEDHFVNLMDATIRLIWK